MASNAGRIATRQVKPLLSVDKVEAKRRVLNLYKAWYRYIPYALMDFDIPKSKEQCRQKLKEEFLKHKHVTDIRVVDMLVIKGQMELKEVVEFWKQKGHVMNYFKDTQEPQPTDFLSKFVSGKN